MKYRLAATVLALGALGLAPASSGAEARAHPHASARSGPVAYCRAHPTVDHPRIRDSGGMEDNSYAQVIGAAGADNWRCMDGRVLVCNGGASGSGCYKLNPSLKPNKDIRDTCADRPNLDFVAMATTVYSSSTWRCRGKTPVIIKTYPLDKRGFLKATWRPLIGADGKPRVGDDLPADPR
jgi:hypothetical protein